jgi:hypothetical protein
MVRGSLALVPPWLAVLLLVGLGGPLAAQGTPGGLHEVVVTGRGTTDEEALRAAFVTALERTVGAIVHSATVSRNFQLESDIQMLLTNGCIDSYDELSSSRAGGVVSKTIRARVRRGLVVDWMRRSGWTGEADLGDTWARLATTIRSRRQALAMLHGKMPAIRDALYQTVAIDLSTGREADGSNVPPPFTEENLDGDVLCVWAAALRPDLAFWDHQAAPLLAACFETLCEKKARLFLNMETAPAGFPAGGSFARIANRRWQRFTPGEPPPWHGARPIEAPPHAPHCIALETRTSHAGSLDLALYFFTPEVYQRIVAPPGIRDDEGNLVAEPERFNSLRCGLHARLEFSDGSSKSFSVIQTSPLFRPLPLPWPGGVEAAYCGPFLFPSMHKDGWEEKSAWPAWHGPIRPSRRTPGFAPFLIDAGRIQRADGEAAHTLRAIIATRRAPLHQTPPPWETDDEVIIPLVFNLHLDEIRRIRRRAPRAANLPPGPTGWRRPARVDGGPGDGRRGNRRKRRAATNPGDGFVRANPRRRVPRRAGGNRLAGRGAPRRVVGSPVGPRHGP